MAMQVENPYRSPAVYFDKEGNPLSSGNGNPYFEDPAKYDQPVRKGFVPDPVPDEQIFIEGVSRVFEGVVIDAENATPVPGATVILNSATGQLAGTAANAKGEFQILDQLNRAANITISSVGYQTRNIPAGEAAATRVFPLQKDIKIIDPVVLPPGGGGTGTGSGINNKKLWMYGGLALLVLLIAKES